tara:strand:+ start:370 stop:573 length:204 start_codon:yes stop_codon:yes gene_type:complete
MLAASDWFPDIVNPIMRTDIIFNLIIKHPPRCRFKIYKIMQKKDQLHFIKLIHIVIIIFATIKFSRG